MTASFGTQPGTAITWRIYDRHHDQWVLPEPRTEANCRRWAERNPDRYALVRVDAVETLTEVPL